jgi:hypothetical protein
MHFDYRYTKSKKIYDSLLDQLFKVYLALLKEASKLWLSLSHSFTVLSGLPYKKVEHGLYPLFTIHSKFFQNAVLR